MYENVNVCITPKGDKPVLHFSQFDNENVFTVTVLADDGESAAVLTGLDIEFRIRKTDSHVVTIAPESVADNIITFKTTEQMCACCGQNIASVVLMKDDMIISTLDILVDIQRDILSGGLTSESDIRNLTTQIEQIVPEVVGDDYYTKTEVDELIDSIPTFDPTNYYDKSDIDGLLADKADSDDVYTKSDVDGLLADKADSDDVYTKSDVYNKTETDNRLSAKMDTIGYQGIVDEASVISFTTDCNAPLDIIKGKIDPSPNGFSALNVTRTGKNLLDKSLLIDQVGWNIFTLQLAPNTTYTMSSNLPNSATSELPCYVFPSSGNPSSSNLVYSGHSVTLTTLSDGLVKIQQRRVSGTDSFQNYNWQIENGNQSSEYHAYNGQTVTVNFGRPVTIGGVVDLTNGKITLSDDTEISITPVTVLSIAGDNNIFLDTGNLTEIAYFEGAEDNLIKLIKACQI